MQFLDSLTSVDRYRLLCHFIWQCQVRKQKLRLRTAATETVNGRKTCHLQFVSPRSWVAIFYSFSIENNVFLSNSNSCLQFLLFSYVTILHKSTSNIFPHNFITDYSIENQTQPICKGVPGRQRKVSVINILRDKMIREVLFDDHCLTAFETVFWSYLCMLSVNFSFPSDLGRFKYFPHNSKFKVSLVFENSEGNPKVMLGTNAFSLRKSHHLCKIDFGQM